MAQANSIKPSEIVVGTKVERWTVIEILPRVPGKKINMQRVVCRCMCGTVKPLTRHVLCYGGTNSCGCYRSERSALVHRKHGGSKLREYHVWARMIQRCHDSNSSDYARYGGRGITVCPRWRKSFQAFLDDMGLAPSPKHQIERKKNDQPYSPQNCTWVTASEQQRNKRNSHLVTFRGKTMCLAAWAELLGVKQHMLYWRLKRGWSIERTLTTPVGAAIWHPQFQGKE